MSDASTPEKYPDGMADTPTDTVARTMIDCAPSTTSRKRPRRRLRLGQAPTVDGRSRLARVFRATRASVLESLGGTERVTPQQQIAIRLLSEAEALRAGIFGEATHNRPMDSEDHARFAKTTIQCLKLLGLESVAKDVSPQDDIDQLSTRKPVTIDGTAQSREAQATAVD